MHRIADREHHRQQSGGNFRRRRPFRPSRKLRVGRLDTYQRSDLQNRVLQRHRHLYHYRLMKGTHHMLLQLTLCACLIASTAGAAEQTARRAAVPVVLVKRILKSFAFAVNPAVVTATPATITFTSPDPDTTPTSGSSVGTVTWTMDGNNKNWSVTANATSASFTGCTAIPVSAVQFSCSGFTNLGGGNKNGGCISGTLTLSTMPQTIASGSAQGNGSGASSFTVSFTFTDAWKYPASPGSTCSVSINYDVTAN